MHLLIETQKITVMSLNAQKKSHLFLEFNNKLHDTRKKNDN